MELWSCQMRITRQRSRKGRKWLYPSRMKPQNIINIVFVVAFVGYVVWQRNPTFGTITCKSWYVVDADGKHRIQAFTSPIDGFAGVTWSGKGGKQRITAFTDADGQASVQWYDTDRHCRIAAETYADGRAYLPTTDRNPPKKP